MVSGEKTLTELLVGRELLLLLEMLFWVRSVLLVASEEIYDGVGEEDRRLVSDEEGVWNEE